MMKSGFAAGKLSFYTQYEYLSSIIVGFSTLFYIKLVNFASRHAEYATYQYDEQL